MSRIIIPSGSDWLSSANLADGVVFVDGRMCELLYPELWEGCVAAYSHTLDPNPWDYSNNGNHGVRNGGVSDAGDGWILNGSTGYIATADDIKNISLGNVARTIGGWFYSTSLTHAGQFITTGSGNCTRKMLFIGPEGAGFGNVSTACDDLTSSLAVPTDEWVFCCGKHDTGTITVFVNNNSESKTLASSIDLQTSRLFVGVKSADNGSSFAFYHPGRIANIGVWDTAISDALIEQFAQHRNIAYECRLLPRVFDMSSRSASRYGLGSVWIDEFGFLNPE